MSKKSATEFIQPGADHVTEKFSNLFLGTWSISQLTELERKLSSNTQFVTSRSRLQFVEIYKIILNLITTDESGKFRQTWGKLTEAGEFGQQVTELNGLPFYNGSSMWNVDKQVTQQRYYSGKLLPSGLIQRISPDLRVQEWIVFDYSTTEPSIFGETVGNSVSFTVHRELNAAKV